MQNSQKSAPPNSRPSHLLIWQTLFEKWPAFAALFQYFDGRIGMVQKLLPLTKSNRPLRSGRKGRQEEIFTFRWKDAEAKRLAANWRF